MPGSPEPEDRVDGPAIFAFLGDDQPTSAYALGTREYDWHSHRRGQLFCIGSGLVHVRTSHGSWLLPPHRAGWMPPGEPHKVSITGAMTGWTVLVAPAASCDLPAAPCVVGISALMRAATERAMQWVGQDVLTIEQGRVAAVLVDEIRRAPHEPLHLPMPSDPRLLRIATRILSDPGEDLTLDEWANWAAMSSRTLRRAILAETGLSFSQWRQQARLTLALERLAMGEPIAIIADALGYATPSAFIAMFKRAFGISPTRYFTQDRLG